MVTSRNVKPLLQTKKGSVDPLTFLRIRRAALILLARETPDLQERIVDWARYTHAEILHMERDQ